MTDPAAVSVIIPLHQGEETVGETLDSLRVQGEVSVEVIVVDDRSSDRGPDIARSHAAAPRVIASRGPGPAAARNTGFAVARGRYIVFLDADDLLLPGALARRVAAADAAGGGSVVVGQYEELAGGARRPVPATDRFRDGSPASFLRGNRLMVHAALTPRGQLAVLEGPFDEAMWHGEDWGVWLRLACRQVPFVPLEAVDCLYRRRAGSLSTDRERVPDDAIRLLRRARAWLPGGPEGRALEAVRRRQLHRWHGHRAIRRLSRGNVAGAAGDVLAAVAAAPLESLRWPALLLRRSSGE